MEVRTDTLLARFERCTFDRLHVGGFRPGAPIAFVDCVMTDLFADPRRPSGRAVFVGCRIEALQGNAQDLPRRNLNDLFPDWQKRVQG